jgi:hypothetical protein
MNFGGFDPLMPIQEDTELHARGLACMDVRFTIVP